MLKLTNIPCWGLTVNETVRLHVLLRLALNLNRLWLFLLLLSGSGFSPTAAAQLSDSPIMSSIYNAQSSNRLKLVGTEWRKQNIFRRLEPTIFHNFPTINVQCSDPLYHVNINKHISMLYLKFAWIFAGRDEKPNVWQLASYAWIPQKNGRQSGRSSLNLCNLSLKTLRRMDFHRNLKNRDFTVSSMVCSMTTGRGDSIIGTGLCTSQRNRRLKLSCLSDSIVLLRPRTQQRTTGTWTCCSTGTSTTSLDGDQHTKLPSLTQSDSCQHRWMSYLNMEVVLAFMLQVRASKEVLQWKHQNNEIHRYLNITSEAKAKLLLHLLMRNALFLHQGLKHDQHKETEIDSNIWTNSNSLWNMSCVIGTGTSTVCSTCWWETRSSCIKGWSTTNTNKQKLTQTYAPSATHYETCPASLGQELQQSAPHADEKRTLPASRAEARPTQTNRNWLKHMNQQQLTLNYVLNHWDRNFNNLLHMLLHPSLCNHLLFHLLLLYRSHGHRNPHCLLNVLMLDSSLRNDLWQLNFLLHHWHWYFNSLFNSLGNDLGSMNNLFLHHRHRYFNNLLNLFVLRTLLSADLGRSLGSMRNLLLDLQCLQRFMQIWRYII